MFPPRLNLEESIAESMNLRAASTGVVPSVSIVGWKRTIALGGADGFEGV
jgi:hypothetical protein